MCEMCDGKTEDQVRRELLARIAERDYTLVNVRQDEERGRVRPGFAYTVGLWTFHRVPEAIVVGAPEPHGVELVTRYAELVKAGRRFGRGGPHAELLPAAGVMVELVAPEFYQDWFAWAFDFYPTGDFPAYQLLWPDRDGVWPWDSRWLRHRVPQPVLTGSGRPESWPVRVSG